jgi:hypothetical protein
MQWPKNATDEPEPNETAGMEVDVLTTIVSIPVDGNMAPAVNVIPPTPHTSQEKPVPLISSTAGVSPPPPPPVLPTVSTQPPPATSPADLTSAVDPPISAASPVPPREHSAALSIAGASGAATPLPPSAPVPSSLLSVPPLRNSRSPSPEPRRSPRLLPGPLAG